MLLFFLVVFLFNFFLKGVSPLQNFSSKGQIKVNSISFLMINYSALYKVIVSPINRQIKVYQIHHNYAFL